MAMQTYPITNLTFTPSLRHHLDKIKEYQEKMKQIESNACDELQELMEILNLEKGIKLSLLRKSRDKQLRRCRTEYEAKMHPLEEERKQKLESLKNYTIQQLEHIKHQIQRTQKPIPVDLKSIFEDWQQIQSLDDTHHWAHNHNLSSHSHFPHNTASNPPRKKMRRAMTSRQFEKKFERLKSLTDDQIDEDWEYLTQKAREKGIEIAEDPVFPRRRRKYASSSRQGKDIMVNEKELKEIQQICHSIGITLHERMLTVKLYGFETHLSVYRQILHWIEECSSSERNDEIKLLKTNKLRDLQVKLASTGTVGRRDEMASGVRSKLNYLAKCMKQ